MENKITLTPDELERIKDEVAFRTDTTLRLKTIEEKIKQSNGLKPWVVAHTWCMGIFLLVLGWIFLRGGK